MKQDYTKGAELIYLFEKSLLGGLGIIFKSLATYNVLLVLISCPINLPNAIMSVVEANISEGKLTLLSETIFDPTAAMSFA